jgi:hypothetical protein
MGSTTASLPANWANTGEGNNSPTGDGSAPNGVVSGIEVTGSNVTNVDYGIDQLPESNNVTTSIGIYNYTQSLASAPLAGSDPEDGPAYTPTTDVKITSLPTNGILSYNGVPLGVGDVITDYDPALLTYKWTTNPSATSDVFTFATIDAAGLADPTPATYTINFPAILPVNLISFTATGEKCNVKLNWRSAQEDNFGYYQVETSRDGRSFGEVLKVNGKGSNSSYEALLENSAKGKLYVRLKLVDKNGTFKYSEVALVSVNCDKGGSIVLYPNPASNVVKLQMNVKAGKYTIDVLSQLGGVVIRRTEQTVDGQVIEVRGLERLAKGVYYVRVSEQHGSIYYEKLIVN